MSMGLAVCLSHLLDVAKEDFSKMGLGHILSGAKVTWHHIKGLVSLEAAFHFKKQK